MFKLVCTFLIYAFSFEIMNLFFFDWDLVCFIFNVTFKYFFNEVDMKKKRLFF